ncbi:hypothetical protein ABEB36_012000 [Hypothenemus hampei]|uniref:Uncharacterized protein n=1 Tax=Hypothenemus hampei TaxID=57062 RepID=A0ABD1EA12_HYPHA
MNKTSRTVLITGCKEGIGFETALQLASRNWQVLMADKQDLTATRNSIISKTSNCNITIHNLDLSCFQSIRQFAHDIKTCHTHIDVLINNAGLFQGDTGQSVDCFNVVMQVNHLGPFLLTTLLTDLLKHSSQGRIVFLTSSGAFLHNLHAQCLPNLHKSDSWCTKLCTYYNSKLCNMIVTKEFALRLQNSNITCNCLHPGMTSSNLLQLKQYSPLAFQMLKLVTQPPQVSAAMVVFLAASRTVTSVTGQYFVNYKIARMPKIVEDLTYCKKIWTQAEDCVGQTQQ